MGNSSEVEQRQLSSLISSQVVGSNPTLATKFGDSCRAAPDPCKVRPQGSNPCVSTSFGVEVARVAILACHARDDGFESRVPRQLRKDG